MTTLLSCILIAQGDNGTNQRIEKELARWKPDKSIPAPPDSVLLKTLDLSGNWARDSGFEGSGFQFRRTGPGVYAVCFETGGCLSSWELKRKATFLNGVVTLDKPVRQYTPSTFNTIYAIHFNGHVVLTTAKDYQEMLTVNWKPGGNSFTPPLKWYAFERVQKR